MFLLSILIPIAYIPGVTGAALATGWAVMSASLPFVVKRGGVSISPLDSILAFAFGAYVLISLHWTDNPDTGLSEVWYLALMALAFYAGAMQTDLRRVAIGLAIGFGVSSILTLVQSLGINLVPEFVPCRPSGLLYNPIVLGEGCALTILLLLSYRLYPLALVLVPGLVLSQSRAAFLTLAIGLVAQYVRPQRGLFSIAPIWAACPLTYAALIDHDYADGFRLLVWRVLWWGSNSWGHGPGSVEAVLIRFNGHLYAPIYAHNEFLDLFYQFGVGALPAFALLLLPLFQTSRREWPAYVGFTICLIFSFPLHSPPLAFLGMVVAGSLSRGWSFSRSLIDDSRLRPSLSPSLAGAGS